MQGKLERTEIYRIQAAGRMKLELKSNAGEREKDLRTVTIVVAAEMTGQYCMKMF